MPEKERQRGDGVERALGSAPLDRCYALAWFLGSPMFACDPAPPEDDEGGEAGAMVAPQNYCMSELSTPVFPK
jgi:hypothetical protein